MNRVYKCQRENVNNPHSFRSFDLTIKKKKVTTSDIFNHTHTAYPFGNEGESALIVYEAFRVERFSRK